MATRTKPPLCSGPGLLSRVTTELSSSGGAACGFTLFDVPGWSCALHTQTVPRVWQLQQLQAVCSQLQVPALQPDGSAVFTDSKSSSSSPSGQVTEQEIQQSHFITQVTFASLLHTKR